MQAEWLQNHVNIDCSFGLRGQRHASTVPKRLFIRATALLESMYGYSACCEIMNPPLRGDLPLNPCNHVSLYYPRSRHFRTYHAQTLYTFHAFELQKPLFPRSKVLDWM